MFLTNNHNILSKEEHHDLPENAKFWHEKSKEGRQLMLEFWNTSTLNSFAGCLSSLMGRTSISPHIPIRDIDRKCEHCDYLAIRMVYSSLNKEPTFTGSSNSKSSLCGKWSGHHLSMPYLNHWAYVPSTTSLPSCFLHKLPNVGPST